MMSRSITCLCGLITSTGTSKGAASIRRCQSNVWKSGTSKATGRIGETLPDSSQRYVMWVHMLR